MKTIKSISCLYFIIFMGVYVNCSLERQYSLAYEFARDREGFSYTHGQAYIWAKKFVEDKAIFRSKTLVSQYNEAFRFALDFLAFSHDEADLWSKKIVLERGTIPLRSQISTQLNAFFNQVAFSAEEGKIWAKNFLSSSEPLISKIDMNENYRDVYNFCRTHIFLGYDHATSSSIAKKFINNRFRFSNDYSLLEQYVIAFRFANNSEGLRLEFEESRTWAKDYLMLRGVLSPAFGLDEQYKEIFQFARSSGGLRLPDEESVSWARKFIKLHAEFSRNQNLLDRYREAFLFAYTGEVLEYLTQIREAQAGVFLRDVAKKYAQDLTQKRGIEINPIKGLQKQYREAFIFAYSSDGLQLDYYKAKDWAKKVLEYRIVR